MKFENLPKVKSLKRLIRYKLPIPETLFIFDFKKQEKEIDKFLSGKREVSIRSDRAENSQFCPSVSRCPINKAKLFCRKINKQGYTVILHEYLPMKKNRLACGHILTLKDQILFELVDRGAVSRLDRQGEVAEIIRFRKKDFVEIEHFGQRIVSKSALKGIYPLIKDVPPFKVLDFTLLKRGVYFYQLQDDRTASRLSGF
jgi:hypothetical protein